MRRRQFTFAATALASSTLLLPSGESNSATSAVASAPTPAADAPQAGLKAGLPALGTNLSGMEWAQPGLRAGESTAPNLSFTVPRSIEVAWLASCGYTKNRLPIQWELLQPMLHDTTANAAARAAIGEPGVFHPAYESFITGVLDAHAAAGITCIIDLHNYCRYKDFRYQPDGAVIGLTVPGDPLVRPYTKDSVHIQGRIFSLAPGATLKRSHFADFWVRAATKWKGHPGLGGYGLMNEPHDLPAPGSIVETNESDPSSGREDLAIWPAYAQAAIQAIRTVDPLGVIYVAGNKWGSAMALATQNPVFPLSGGNLVYEIHMYLDASSSGAKFDYDTEVAKNFSAGTGRGPIRESTGVDRLRGAIEWGKAKGVRLALTETGMPIDDPRWEKMFRSAISYALQSGCEVQSWMGGSHWPIRSFPINHVAGWHQNKTLPPLVSGALQACAGLAQATLFDDGPAYAAPGVFLVITVYARGNLLTPVTLKVTSSKGGTFNSGASTSVQVTIPAGSNGQASFTFIPAINQVTTLTYAGAQQVPPPRKVFSLTNPVAHATSRLEDAAHAILARYNASKWDMADGHTDFMLGRPAKPGDTLRAVSDSAYGSSPGNAMEMVNFVNVENKAMGGMSLPVMRLAQGRKHSDHSALQSYGFWCKKTAPVAGVQANPKNRVPYNIEDPHFMLAAVSVARPDKTGLVFQASRAEERYTAELGFVNGQAQARWLDAKGQQVQLLSPAPVVAGAPSVLTLASRAGRQKLRVNGAEVASAAASFAPSLFTQMLIGWGFAHYYPQGGFGGAVYAVITGKGNPADDELAVLERYLAGVAGVSMS